MGLLDWLLGRKEEPRTQPEAPTSRGPGDGGQQPPDADEQALQRYRYMLRTAPPETIEQAHEEAFAKLTPAQRAQALRELAAVTPEGERAALAGDHDDPKSLARMATRAEMRRPGTMERTFGGVGRGPGMGGMMGGLGGTIFASLAAGFVGSLVAQQFLDSVGDFGFDEGDTSEQSGDEETYADAGATPAITVAVTTLAISVAAISAVTFRPKRRPVSNGKFSSVRILWGARVLPGY